MLAPKLLRDLREAKLRILSSLLQYRHILECVAIYVIGAIILWLSLHPAFYYLVWVPILTLAFLLAGLAWCLPMALTGKVRKPLKFTILTLHAIIVVSFFHLPLKVAFLTIRPQLASAIPATPSEFVGLQKDISSVLFKISAESTNLRFESNRSNNWNTNRLLFILADDHEAAFIYSPSGLKGLVYNSGSCGHLYGPWYWMKED